MAKASTGGELAGLRSDLHSHRRNGEPLRCGYGSQAHGYANSGRRVGAGRGRQEVPTCRSPAIHSAVEQLIGGLEHALGR